MLLVITTVTRYSAPCQLQHEWQCCQPEQKKVLKTYLKAQFNSPVYSGKWQSMARYGLDGFWIQQVDSFFTGPKIKKKSEVANSQNSVAKHN